MPRWISDEPGEEAALLESLGIPSVDALFADVPKKARIGRIGIAAGLEEPEVVAHIDKILDRNRPLSKFSSFLGGRISTRYSPAAVDSILSRSEFFTSYTPYQPKPARACCAPCSSSRASGSS